MSRTRRFGLLRKGAFLVTGTVAIGLGLTAVVFTLVQTRENERQAAELDRQIAFQNELLDARIRSISEVFRCLGRLFEAHRDPGNSAFVAVTADAQDRYREVQVILWVAAGSTADPNGLSKAHRDQPALDFPAPAATQPDIHTGPQPEHFPIHCLSGRAPAGLEDGGDLAMQPGFLRLLRKSRETGELVLDEAITRLDGRREGRRLAVIVPVFAPAAKSETALPNARPCEGFVLGILNVDEFTEAAMQSLRPLGLDWRRLEASSKMNSSRRSQLRPIEGPDLRADTTTVGGFCWDALMTLIAGLACTLMASAHTYSVARRAEQIQAQVVERTAALRRTQSELKTELKLLHLTQTQLRESQRDLLHAQEIAGLGIWKWDWHTNQVTCSEQVWKLYGRPPRPETTLDQFVQWLRPEERERLHKLKTQARAGQPVAPVEFHVTSSDGAERILRGTVDVDLDPAQQPVGIIGTFQDITASKIIEMELRKQREDYSMIFNLVPALIMYKDSEGRILRANQTTAQELGLRVEQIEGRTFAELGQPAAEISQQDDLQVITSGQPRFGVLEPIQHASGRRLWLETDKVPHRDPGGHISGIVVLAQNITECKAAQESLERRTTELSVLDAFVTSLNKSLEVDQVLTSLQEHLVELAGAVSGVIAFYHPDGSGGLNLDRSWGLDPDVREVLRRELQEKGVPELPIEIEEKPGQEGAPRATGRLRIPLLAEGEVVGVMELWGPERGGGGRLSLDFFRTMGMSAGLALHHARLFEEARADRERLRALSMQLMAVQETERRLLGQELHDEIGQLLSALKLAIETDSRGSRSRASHMVDDLLQRVRKMSLDLRPAMLDDLGLVPAVLWLVKGFGGSAGLSIQFEHSGVEQRFSAMLETAAFRIAQEALTNAVRHAQAERIMVRIWADEAVLAVQVEDAGVGFDPETVMQMGRSGGLSGLRERVRLLGGELTIESARGRGTRLLAELPLQPLTSKDRS